MDATTELNVGAAARLAGVTVRTLHVSPAADTPWNIHELMVADSDGNRFTFTARAVQPQAQTFAETMENASRSEGRGSPSR